MLYNNNWLETSSKKKSILSKPLKQPQAQKSKPGDFEDTIF